MKKTVLFNIYLLKCKEKSNFPFPTTQTQKKRKQFGLKNWQIWKGELELYQLNWKNNKLKFTRE